MNSRARPIRSAAPSSSASRSSLRSALNTIERVVVVTMLALPSGRLHRQRRQPVAFAVALVGDEPAHVLAVEQPRVVPAAGRVDLQEHAQFVAALRIASKTPPVRGSAATAAAPARWSQTRSRSQRCGMPVRSKWLPRCGNRTPKWSVSMNPASRVSAGVK